MDDVLTQAGDVADKVLVNCSMPMNGDDTELVIGHTSSGAEQLAKKTRGSTVVSAFTTVPSEVLFPVFNARGAGVRPSLLSCGDDDEVAVHHAHREAGARGEGGPELAYTSSGS